MKKHLTLLTLLLFTHLILEAQSIGELYKNRNYHALITFADKADDLTMDDLYCIGFAFFQLERDKEAIAIYDKAIAKGLDSDYIYLYKGLALRYDQQMEAAIENFKLAVERNPQGQKNYTELANCYYQIRDYETALAYFTKARELPFELGDPYLKIPTIYHIQQNFEKALEEYKISSTLVPKEVPTYAELLKEIGLLEFTVTKNYAQSIEAYSTLIDLNPKDYDLYPKLIKAYYANEEFEKGEAIFAELKTAFENKTLPEDIQKFGHVPIAEFDWKDQKLIVYKYFKAPEETLDLMYKIYLLAKDGKSIERTFMTEKALSLDENESLHLLCERERDGAHHTYSYGWNTDKINFIRLKEAVLAVLNGSIQPTASSSLTEPTKGKKKKKRESKK